MGKYKYRLNRLLYISMLYIEIKKSIHYFDAYVNSKIPGAIFTCHFNSAGVSPLNRKLYKQEHICLVLAFKNSS
jgi:hypothetical protein